VTSDEDRLYPAALAEAMARRIPGARLATIRGAGHLSNLEQPAAFDAAVLPFLLEHRDRASIAQPPKQ
jgi:pimeloyl-ACP methyl ester carboxylesterase